MDRFPTVSHFSPNRPLKIENAAPMTFFSQQERCPEPVVPDYFSWKPIVDIVLASLMLIPALPIILVAMLLVKWTSKGPGIYTQVRVGKDGRVFTIYKIRSMRVDAEAATGAIWAQKKDPRATSIGRILRKLHIDELPQLFNVIKGDMSLVGPRPERPEIVNILDKKIDGYIHRLRVKPGITGYAQLNHHSDRDLNDVRKKVVYDLEYIQHATLRFDLLLIFGTALKTVNLCNPTTLKLLGLYRNVEDSSWAEPLQVSPDRIALDAQTLSAILTTKP